MISAIMTVVGVSVQLAEVAPKVRTVAIIVALNGCVAMVGVSPVPCSSLPWNASCTERELCSISMKPWKKSK